jgi:hypothetical protein
MHDVQLNLCISEAKLREFEASYNVTLPEAYRSFLLNIGNGGNFPGYGLIPLEAIVAGSHLFTYLQSDPLYLSKPFPLTSQLDLITLQTQQSASRLDGVRAYDPAYYRKGLLPIADYGCGICYSMVLTGPQRGRIWRDNFANGAGIFPICSEQGQQFEFLDWLEDELIAEQIE